MDTNFRNIILPLLIIVLALLSTPTVLAQAGYDLMRAAYSGDLQQLRAILEAGADVNMRDSSESTPLMLAASKGHIEIVRELLAKGANINLQNNYGWTSLMLATTNRHTEIVRLLSTRNTDSNIANQQGDVPVLPPKNADSAALISEVNIKPTSDRVQTTADNIPTQEDTIRSDIAELLKTAEHQIESLRLTKPAKNNAYTTFLRVLELDSQNLQAKDGLQRIAAYYEKRARQYMTKGAVQSSLIYVKRGLKIMPEHHGFLAVQSDANTLVKAKKAQQQRVAPAQKELRDKMAALNQVEKKQFEEEKNMRRSIQNLLQRKFKAKEN